MNCWDIKGIWLAVHNNSFSRLVHTPILAISQIHAMGIFIDLQSYTVIRTHRKEMQTEGPKAYASSLLFREKALPHADGAIGLLPLEVLCKLFWLAVLRSPNWGSP